MYTSTVIPLYGEVSSEAGLLWLATDVYKRQVQTQCTGNASGTLRNFFLDTTVGDAVSYTHLDVYKRQKYNHVECFGVVHLVGCVHGIDTIYLDILAGRRVDNSVTVINQDKMCIRDR